VISELVCIPLAMLFWKRNWSSLRISMERVSKNDAITLANKYRQFRQSVL